MKRTLIGILTLGLLAMAFAAQSQPSKHHAAKSTQTLSAAANGSICSDPSHCPHGCTRSAATSTASVAVSSGLKTAAGACNGMDPAKCPAGCRKAAAGATAERLASR
jgi:hypothetical protein